MRFHTKAKEGKGRESFAARICVSREVVFRVLNDMALVRAASIRAPRTENLIT